MKNFANKIQQRKSCYLLLLFLISSSMAQAQWTQMGPGAGGQERAVYIYETPTTNMYDVYVGSDVSGVWRAPNISKGSFDNPNLYHYNFISNHEIMRFVNKFYRADNGAQHYLFCLNRSGIDRIELDNNGTMKSVPITPWNNNGNQDDSWVIDMHISPNTTNKQTYFITGNARVTDNGPGNGKDADVNDIFAGGMNANYDGVTLTSSKKLHNLTGPKRDVYCLYVDENIDNNPADDLLFAGAENGLHVITNTELISANILPSSTFMTGPSLGTNYKVTSLRLVKKEINGTTSTYNFLVTIHGMGLYKAVFTRDVSGSVVTMGTVWTKLSNGLMAVNGGTPSCGAALPNINPQFTSTLPIYITGNLTGYYIFNETNTEKLCSGDNANYFEGVYYCSAGADGFPNSTLAPLTVWGNNNDWGWNAAKPAANIYGATMTPDNTILMGKQGNIFTTENNIQGQVNENVSWQQIYTTAYPTGPPNCSANLRHRGYVNTANKAVYPVNQNLVWIGQLDRLFFNSLNGGLDFNDLGSTCYDIIQPTWNAVCFQGNGTPPTKYQFTDCFFITNNKRYPVDTKIYAGIAEGYATFKGAGFIMEINNTSDFTWQASSTATKPVCGDPLKILFNNTGEKYAIFNVYVFTNNNNIKIYHRQLFYFNQTTSVWDNVPLYNGNDYDLTDAELAPIGDRLFVYTKQVGTNIQYNDFDVFTGGPITWTNSGLTQPGLSPDVVPQILSIVPYNNFNYSIICGTSPKGDYSNGTNNLAEIYTWNNATLTIQNNVLSNGSQFLDLNQDPVDHVDEGVTAVEIDETNLKIYAGTVGNTANVPTAHLYYTNYDPVTKTISPIWSEILGMPNKTIASLKAFGEKDCNERIYACLRGLGVWHHDYTPVTINGILTNVTCAGGNNGSVSVTSPYSGTSTYLWNTTPPQTTATASGLTAGTYIVTVTNGINCSATLQVDITEPYPLSIEFQNTPVTCQGATDGQLTALPVGGTAPYSYMWYNNSTAQTVSGLAVGTYTVTVTDANGCPSVSATATVGVDNLSCNVYNNCIPNQAAFDVFATSGTSAQYDLNTSVIFNNSNGAYTITDCDFSIKEAVSITVPANVVVDIINCDFISCGNMWKGFIVEPGGTLNIIGGSLLRDAQYAVHLQGDCNLRTDDVVFEHNFADIKIDNMTNSGTNIMNTTFSCDGCYDNTSPLVDGYAGQSPDPSTITFAGIDAANSTFNVGIVGKGANHFIGLNCGVNIKDCFTTILNSDFIEIRYPTNYPLFLQRTSAVFADNTKNGYLRQVGFGKTAASSFTNCNFAIYVTGGQILAEQNRMTNVGNGIRVNSVINNTIDINNNDIGCQGVGIQLTDNDYAYNVIVKWNHIYNSSVAGISGIKVFEKAMSNAARSFTISCNNIEAHYGLGHGIQINSANGVSLASNIIYGQGPGNGANITGIGFYGAAYCNVLENSVTCNLGLETAYRFVISPSNNITHNSANNTDIGFEFMNVCSNTLFRDNTMNNHNLGLHLDNSAIIGLQTQHGNKWLKYANGNNSGWVGSRNDNNLPGGNGWQASKFFVHPSSAPDVYFPNNIVAGNAVNSVLWFQPFPGTPFTYTSPVYCDLPEPAEEEALRLDTLIVHGAINTVDFDPEAEYIAKRIEGEKVEKNPIMRNDNGLFQAFADSLQNTSAGLLQNIQLNLQNSFSNGISISNLDSILNIYADSLVYYDSLMNVTPTSQLKIARANCNVIYKTKINLLAMERHAIDSVQQIQYNNSMLNNAPIIISNDIESTEKSVNQFIFNYDKTELRFIPNAAVLNLQYISNLCPFAYGTSVYKARTELNRLGIDTITYDDKTTCAQLGYLRKPKTATDTNQFVSQMTINPNPSNGVTTINFNNEICTKDEIQIIDMAGKVVLNFIIKNASNELQIDLKSLLASVYTVKYIGCKSTLSAKLILIK